MVELCTCTHQLLTANWWIIFAKLNNKQLCVISILVSQKRRVDTRGPVDSNNSTHTRIKEGEIFEAGRQPFVCRCITVRICDVTYLSGFQMQNTRDSWFVWYHIFQACYGLELDLKPTHGAFIPKHCVWATTICRNATLRVRRFCSQGSVSHAPKCNIMKSRCVHAYNKSINSCCILMFSRSKTFGFWQNSHIEMLKGVV